jgi:hypothetical protein
VIDHGFLLNLGKDLNYPRVRGPRGLTLERGAEPWAAARLTPMERLSVLVGLRGALLAATPGGRQRLALWRRPTRPASRLETRDERRRRLRTEVHYYGDSAMLDLVTEVFVVLPTPLVDSLLPSVAIAGIGWSTRGLFMGGRLVGPDGEQLPRVILLCGASRDPDRVANCLLHELGHLWLHGPERTRTAPPAPRAIGREALFALASEEGWRDRLDEMDDRDERLAVSFARAFNPLTMAQLRAAGHDQEEELTSDA